MVLHHISPSVQRRLAVEVLYLHYLWHQGLPQNCTRSHIPNPNSNLRPLKSNEFKTKKKRRRTNDNRSQLSDHPGAEIEYLHSLWHQGPPQNSTPSHIPNPNPKLRPVKSNEFKTKKKGRRRTNDNQYQLSDHPAAEIEYLHSLWHQGPPQNSTPSHIPNPNPNMRTVKSIEFETKKKKRRRRTNGSQSQLSDHPGAEIEWPVNPKPDRNADPDSWPEPARNTYPQAPPQAVDEARANARRVHWDALQWCRDFFSKDGSDGDDTTEDEDDEEESKAFKFFLGLFENDWELRGYYEKNHEKGEFSCLVCEGTGVKLGKRYGDCVGLVQHSNAIAKAKRRGAHRGFSRAVCRVLGLNIERLPNIVLDTGKPLWQYLNNAAAMQEDTHIQDGTEIAYIPNDDAWNDDDNGALADCIKAKETEVPDEDMRIEDGTEIVVIPNEHVQKDDDNVNLANCIKAKYTDVPNLMSCGETSNKRDCTEIVVIPDNYDNNVDLTDCIKENESGVHVHFFYGAGQKKDCTEIVVIPDDDEQRDNDNGDLTDSIEQNATEVPNKEGVRDGKKLLSESGKHLEGRKKKKKRSNKNKHFFSTPSIPVAVVWPCKPSISPNPDAPSREGLVQVPSSSQPRQPPSTDEQERATAVLVQQNAVKGCRNFLANADDSSSDDGDDEEMANRELVGFQFFLKLFEMDINLKNYYANNSHKGEFCCLVCGGIGKKTWKKFGDCVGLVQHSMSIFSTKNIFSTKSRWAHLAFGRVVCKVLAWDINRYTGTTRTSKESLSQVLENSVKTPDDANIR